MKFLQHEFISCVATNARKRYLHFLKAVYEIQEIIHEIKLA